MYEERRYRQYSQSEGLLSFTVCVGETDLFISAQTELSARAKDIVEKLRSELQAYILSRPEFATSLKPLEFDKKAPAIARSMLLAAEKAGVGPMAAVAGIISQFLAEALHQESADVLVENGGDIYLYTTNERILGIWAGENSSFNQYGIKIKAEQSPLSVCCSSGTVGHSLSFGKADAAIVLSSDGALADACATALGNRVQCKDDITTALKWVSSISGISGAMVVIGEDMGAWGQIELIEL